MNTGAGDTELIKKRFDTITKITCDIIWDWDLVSDKVWWSESFRNCFGYASEDPSIKWWASRIHPQDRDRVVTHIQQVIDSAADMWSDEYRFLRADGTYAQVVDKGFTIVKDGSIIRMIGSVVDMTEQSRLQKDKEQTEDWMRFALEAAELGTWDFNPQTGATRCDEHCRRIHGFVTGQALTLENIVHNIHPHDVELVKKAFADAADPP